VIRKFVSTVARLVIKIWTVQSLFLLVVMGKKALPLLSAPTATKWAISATSARIQLMKVGHLEELVKLKLSMYQHLKVAASIVEIPLTELISALKSTGTRDL
jgi:hypothetical protein